MTTRVKNRDIFKGNEGCHCVVLDVTHNVVTYQYLEKETSIIWHASRGDFMALFSLASKNSMCIECDTAKIRHDGLLLAADLRCWSCK